MTWQGRRDAVSGWREELKLSDLYQTMCQSYWDDLTNYQIVVVLTVSRTLRYHVGDKDDNATIGAP